MKIFLRAIFVAYACVAFSSVFAEQIRDYYAEPGINPFKGTLNQNFNENIDPFGGTLQLKYVDLKIPGNGGLDININRTYTSLQEQVGPYTVNGVGWTMHFGRIVVTDSNADKICNQGNWSIDVRDNPSLELPDGGRELLVLDPTNAYLVTRSRWKAECIIGQNGMVVTSPNGTQYVMDQYEYQASSPTTGTVHYYTSQIKDVHNNTININYKTGYGHTYIDTITASNGRTVKFTYHDENSQQLRLASITANGQTWQYNYVPVVGVAGNYYHLSEVIRPDGTKWTYEYNPQITTLGEAGSHSLKKVIYPYGGEINYTYKPVYFDPADDTFPTTVIATKVTGGRGITPGTWTFEYQPASTVGTNYRDVTTVTAPNGRYVYEHVGYSNTFSDDIWRIGLLEYSEIYDTNGKLLQRESYFWDKQLISEENYWHGRNTTKIDTATYAPIQVQKYVERDGGDAYLTEFFSYDAYGNPAQIKETGNVPGDTRTTDYTYFIDTDQWIINRVEDETITDIGTIDRTFFANGDLKSESKYGVLTEYTYHPTGDLHTVKNARNVTTTYLGYYRGIPQQEIHPVSDTVNITLDRTVNPTGTVATQTNGRRFTTSFTYDNLNRLKTITYPKAGSADVSVDYSATGKVLTRGDYQEVITLDGFGQVTTVERKDKLRNITITSTKEYDALGQLIFESYPNSLDGTDIQSDTLGRQTRVTHPDASYVSFTYLPNNQVRVRNERNFETLYTYRSYGNPDEKTLIRIDSPEAISTTIARNTLGLIETVWQGETGGNGLERRYTYTPEFFLESIDNPETGLTVYGRDAIGNLTSKKVGLSATTTFTYDLQNRLEFTDYTDINTPDITTMYDENGNVKTVSNASSTRTYDYDANDNLLTETVRISSNTWAISYDYNSLDHLVQINYPSLRNINYQPDALGRATQAAPYLTSVSYYPSGQVQQLVYANGRVTDYAQDSRLRVDRITTFGELSDFVDLDYSYDEAGNVTSILDLLSPEYDIHMTYDGVDRLFTADGFWGTGNISYDAIGNINSKTIGNFSLTYSYINNKLYSVSGSDSYQPGYDQYGNMISSSFYEYTYDEASNLQSAILLASLPVGVAPDTYFAYDGNGMRVKRTNNANDIWFVYAGNGNLMGEYRSDETKNKEYFYLGSTLIASVEGLAPPIADAGKDQIVIRDSLVTLDGSNSITPNGTITGYYWEQKTGPLLSMTGTYSAVATFTAPFVKQDTVFTFELTVNDSKYQSSRDSVDITVRILDTDLDGLDDDWEILHFGSLTQTGTADPDQDGYTNLDEFKLDLDPAVPQPPDAPSNVVITTGSDSATINWDDTPRATQYNIYWSTTPGVTPQTGNKIANVTRPFVQENLTYDQQYYYIVTAENIGAGEGEPSIEKIARIGWKAWDNIYTFLDVGVYRNLEGTQTALLGAVLEGEGDHLIALWGKEITTPAPPGSPYWYISNTNVIASILLPDGTWSQPENIDINDGGSAFGLDFRDESTITADSNTAGEFHAAWVRGYADQTYSIITNQFDPSTGWGIPQNIYTTSEYLSSNNDYQKTIEIKLDELGNAILVWHERNRIMMLAYTKGIGWDNEPTVVADSSPEDGALSAYVYPSFGFVMDDAGNTTVIWEKRLYGDETDSYVTLAKKLYSRKYTRNNGWDAAEHLFPNDFTYSAEKLSENIKVTGNNDGNILLLWEDNVGGTTNILSSFYSNATGWQPIVTHGTELENVRDLSINEKGNAVIVSTRIYSSQNVEGAVLSKRYISTIGWQPLETLVPMESNTINRISADINNNNTISVVGHVAVPTSNKDNLISVNHNSVQGWTYDYPLANTTRPLQWEDGTTENRARFGNVKCKVTPNDSIFVLANLNDGIKEAPNTAIAVNSMLRNRGELPIANAGPDRSITSDTLEILDGSASTDPDGNIISYTWKQINGTPVTLTNADSVMASFTAPVPSTPEEELTFQLRVIDDRYNLVTDLVTITIQNSGDTTPPVITPPIDLFVEATGIETVVDLGIATATDDTDGALTPIADITGPFGIGTHLVTWSATDAAGNTGTSTQIVVVEDTTPPELTVPPDITVVSDVPLAVDIGSATATDIFTPVTITNDAPAEFPVGSTVVTWTATDANDNTETETQTVTVTIPPAVALSIDTASPQTVGAIVNLSASLVGVTGDYEYRFRIKGPATGDTWQVLRGYNTTPNYVWDTTGYLGKNRLQAQARLVGTTDTPYRDGQNFWVNDTNAATTVSISTNLPNPQVSGATVTISAQADGGSGEYEYQFRVKGPGTGDSWLVLQDYSTSSSVVWNTTGYLGQHRIQVKARNASSEDKPVRTGRNFWLNDVNPTASVTLSVSPPGPQPEGTTVSLTGTPIGGSGTYEYLFRVKGPATGDVWQVLQDWSTNASHTWNTTGYLGTHRVQVQSRNAGSADRPVRDGMNYTVQ